MRVDKTEFGLPVMVRHDYSGQALRKIHGYVKKVAEFLQPFVSQDFRVLDIGAGDGYLGQVLKCRYQAIDLHPANKEVKRMDFYELAEWSQFFAKDLYVLNHTLEHADSPMRLLNQVNQVAESGALLFIAVPDANDRWAYELYESTTHYACFTMEFLKSLVARFGWSILTGQYREFRPGYKEIWILARKF